MSSVMSTHHLWVLQVPAVRLEVLQTLHEVVQGAPSVQHDTVVATCVLPFLSKVSNPSADL